MFVQLFIIAVAIGVFYVANTLVNAAKPAGAILRRMQNKALGAKPLPSDVYLYAFWQLKERLAQGHTRSHEAARLLRLYGLSCLIIALMMCGDIHQGLLVLLWFICTMTWLVSHCHLITKKDPTETVDTSLATRWE
jgi:hypothetical protein